MPYSIPTQRLSMFFSPKAGGTSLRAYLFHLENGFAFREFSVEGKVKTANSLMWNTPFKGVDHDAIDGFQKFAVIRDPVRRFLSGYSNRVVHFGELSEEAAGPKLKKFGLMPNPPLPEFVENFDLYFKCSRPIRQHFTKQQVWLGTDASYYDQIFLLERIQQMTTTLNRLVGVNAEMPRLQKGGPKIEPKSLRPELLAKILDLVKDDFAFQVHAGYRDAYGLQPDSQSDAAIKAA